MPNVTISRNGKMMASSTAAAPTSDAWNRSVPTQLFADMSFLMNHREGHVTEAQNAEELTVIIVAGVSGEIVEWNCRRHPHHGEIGPARKTQRGGITAIDIHRKCLAAVGAQNEIGSRRIAGLHQVDRGLLVRRGEGSSGPCCRAGH